MDTENPTFTEDDRKALIRALNRLPGTGSYRTPEDWRSITPKELADWLAGYGDFARELFAQSERRDQQYQLLKNDVAALRRVLGTEK